MVHTFPVADPVYSGSGQRGLDDSVVFGHVTYCTRECPASTSNMELGPWTAVLMPHLPSLPPEPGWGARQNGASGGLVEFGSGGSLPFLSRKPCSLGLKAGAKQVFQQFLVKAGRPASGVALSARKHVSLESTLPVACLRPYFEKATGRAEG